MVGVSGFRESWGGREGSRASEFVVGFWLRGINCLQKIIRINCILRHTDILYEHYMLSHANALNNN